MNEGPLRILLASALGFGGLACFYMHYLDVIRGVRIVSRAPYGVFLFLGILCFVGAFALAKKKDGEKPKPPQPPPLEKYQKPPKEKPRELTPDGMRDKSKEGQIDE